jgi:ribonuclease HI
MRFKDAEVLARCDDAGELVAPGGRVEIRYRPQDGRAYHAAVRNLEPLATPELLPDSACAEVKDPPAAGSAKKNGSKPGSKYGARPTKTAQVVGPAPENALLAYTDGACSGNPGPCGAGVVLIDGKQRRELSEYLGEGTNNIAELTAIELALRVAPPERPLRVHTDSQYAIGVLTKGWKAKANQELIAKLRALVVAHSQLELVYVPGHSGVLLNERADVLAVQAVQARASSGWIDIS